VYSRAVVHTFDLFLSLEDPIDLNKVADVFLSRTNQLFDRIERDSRFLVLRNTEFLTTIVVMDNNIRLLLSQKALRNDQQLQDLLWSPLEVYLEAATPERIKQNVFNFKLKTELREKGSVNARTGIEIVPLSDGVANEFGSAYETAVGFRWRAPDMMTTLFVTPLGSNTEVVHCDYQFSIKEPFCDVRQFRERFAELNERIPHHATRVADEVFIGGDVGVNDADR